MTVADRLREIANRLPMVGGRVWDRGPLLEIANELDAKAALIGDYALDHLDGKHQDDLCAVAVSLGRCPQLDAESITEAALTKEACAKRRQV